MTNLIIGCGYLGQRVVRAWQQQGKEVTALTRSEENAGRLQEAGITPVVGDVLRPESLEQLPAAETMLYAVGFDRSSGRSMREVYVDGLQNVLQAMSGRMQRCIYISSTSVHGENDGEWIDEMTVCRPWRPNGQICLEAEQLIHSALDAGSDEGTTASILRMAGLYGPDRLLRRVEAIRGGEPIAADPEGWLNLIHVDDAVRAVCACETRGERGAVYLISDDQPVTRGEYYAALAAAVGGPPPRFTDPADSTGRGTGKNKRCRNDRMHEELQVELAYPTIREGITAAIEEAH